MHTGWSDEVCTRCSLCTALVHRIASYCVSFSLYICNEMIMYCEDGKWFANCNSSSTLLHVEIPGACASMCTYSYVHANEPMLMALPFINPSIVVSKWLWTNSQQKRSYPVWQDLEETWNCGISWLASAILLNAHFDIDTRIFAFSSFATSPNLPEKSSHAHFTP